MEIPVVDADEITTQSERLVQLGLVVDFDQDVEPRSRAQSCRSLRCGNSRQRQSAVWHRRPVPGLPISDKDQREIFAQH